MEPILVTIGITVYNAENTIKKAIDSALSQNWRPIEIIISDDHSTDNSVKIINEYIEEYVYIKLIQNKTNRGVAYNRNKIIDEAKGEFLAFFDDDDISMPDRLQKQVKRILDYERYYHPKSPIICHTAREIIYPDNNQLIAPTMGDNESEIAPNGMPVAEYILLGKPLKNSYGGCPTCSQMMRLSTYKDIGGFDINFRRSEDTELNIRLAKNGTHFVGISEPLVIQKMTKTIDKDIDLEIKYLLMVLRKHKNITDHHNLYHFCYRWIITKKHWLKKNYLRFIYYMLINFITNPFHSFKRLYYSIRNIELNRNFRYFHKSKSC